MIFKELEFTYGTECGTIYDLYIGDFNSNGLENSESVKAEISTEKLSRRPRDYFKYIKKDEARQFKLSLVFNEKKDEYDVNVIKSKFFNSLQRKELRIIQDDLHSISFNCILCNEETIYVGKEPVGFECDVVCDGIFGWENEKSYIYPITDTSKITHINYSNYNDFTIPKIEFKSTLGNGTVSIINNTTNEEFKIEHLQLNEVITIDEFFDVISSTGLNKFNDITKLGFLKLVPNVNNLTVSGNLSELKLTYSNARLI